MKLIKSVVITVVMLLLSYQVHALTAIPAFSQRVVDTTGTLTEVELDHLEHKLRDYDSSRQDGGQIAVLMIATLAGEAIEQYAQRVFASWQIGQQGLDNGILLLIAKNDRQVRVEVGYGLEGDLPDLRAKRIIDQFMVPAFQQQHYYQGIDAGLSAIISQLAHSAADNESVTDPITRVDQVVNSELGSDLINYAIVSFVICLIMGRALPFAALKKSVGKRSLVTGLFNSISTGGFMLWQGLPVTVMLPMLLLTFVASTILCGIITLGRFTGGGGSFRGPRGGGGFGSSGGGFGGGGGGRSGGGGASGRW